MSAQGGVLYDEFENYTFKTIPLPPRGQWVNQFNILNYDNLRGVLGLVCDWPSVVWCRGLTICPLYASIPFENQF